MPHLAYEYSAFISYHRADCDRPDRDWARWIKELLEKFRTAPELAEKASRYNDKVPHSMPKVFVDKSEIAGSGDLPALIRDALAQSRVLIVLCSPGAAASRWVNLEIIEFKKLGRLDPIIPVLIAGEPHSGENPGQECLPEALRYNLLPDGTLDRSSKAQVAWVDFRGLPAELIRGEPVLRTRGAISPKAYRTALIAETRLPKSVIDECTAKYTLRFHDSRIRLLAGVLGLAHDVVDGVCRLRDAEGQKAARRRNLIAAIAIVVMLGLTAFALMERRERSKGQKELVQTKKDFLEVVKERDELRLLALGQAAQFGTSISGGDPDLEMISSDADSLWSAWTKKLEQAFLSGYSESQLPIFGEGARICEVQLAADPDSEKWLYFLGLVHHRHGEYLAGLGRHKEAVGQYQEGLRRLQSGADQYPENLSIRTQLAMTLMQCGSSQFNDGQVKEGESSLEKGISVAEQVVKDDSGPDYIFYLGLTHSALGQVMYHQMAAAKTSGDTERHGQARAAAQKHLEAARVQFQTIPENHRESNSARFNLNILNQLITNVLIDGGELGAAIEVGQENIKVVSSILAQAPDDPVRLLDLARVRGHLCRSYILAAEFAAARQEMADATQTLERVERAPQFQETEDFKGVKQFLAYLREQLAVNP